MQGEGKGGSTEGRKECRGRARAMGWVGGVIIIITTKKAKTGVGGVQA